MGYIAFDFSGESAVGKSSLVLRFVKGQFHEYQESTIGGEFCCANSHFLILTRQYSGLPYANR